MCYQCGRRMRGGSAVHASTAQHRRATRPRSGGAWNRRRDAGDPAPAWTRVLRDWDRQYDELERASDPEWTWEEAQAEVLAA